MENEQVSIAINALYPVNNEKILEVLDFLASNNHEHLKFALVDFFIQALEGDGTDVKRRLLNDLLNNNNIKKGLIQLLS